MSTLGTFERWLGQLSPDRWAVAIVVVALIVALARVGVRRGWHRALAQRPRTAALAAVVALAIAIGLGGYMLRPLWTRTELNEATPIEAAAAGVEAATIVAEGQFRGADAFHFGEGTVRVLATADGAAMVRFEDVSVRNGRDLHVSLSPDPEGDADAALDLGKSRATDGSFNREIPAETNLSGYASVVIRCEPFSVLFAVAPLASVGAAASGGVGERHSGTRATGRRERAGGER